MPGGDGVLLRVRDLAVTFHTRAGQVPAVRGVSYDVHPGEVLGFVGESGSGKSVSALAILRLLRMKSVTVTASELSFEGEDLLRMSRRGLRSLRGGRIGMVFQDPLSSLNPTMRVGRQIAEALMLHREMPRGAAKERAVELMRLVGIPDPGNRVADYPHQFSGGMRQRVMIAIAIACEARLVIADEPTTALDVTVQAQIIDLLGSLRDRFGTGVLMISHDVSLMAGFADRIGVMYAGRLVEVGPAGALLTSPRHPYTQGLLAAVPQIDLDGPRELLPVRGSPPDPRTLPLGCPFAPRCDHATDRCRSEDPPQMPLAGDRVASCWLVEEGQLR